MELKEGYEKLRKKYSLPDYEELDSVFEFLYFGPILEIKFPLRFIRRRICDKINSYVILFQNIIYPNPASLISIEESKFFSEEEKRKIADLLKDLISLLRESVLLDLEHQEKKDAKFITGVFNEWKSLAHSIYFFSELLKRGWEQKTRGEEEREKHYFG